MAGRSSTASVLRLGVMLITLASLLVTLSFASATTPQGSVTPRESEQGLQKILSMIGSARKTVLRLLGLVREECAEGFGYFHLRNPLSSRSTATSDKDRRRLKLRGLLPAGHVPLKAQVENVMRHLRSLPRDIDKYSYLQTLHDNYEALYYAVLLDYTVECMPLVYTPTVGQACQEWHSLHRHTPKGMYLSLEDIGHVREALQNWPHKKVTAVVVTDGERILGLGDLGVNGMGIPIGKLALYTACGGIHPAETLPVQLDTGTDNEALRSDPAYMGLKQSRERSERYDALVQEFVTAVKEKYGANTLIQFEDFGNQNAFRLLERFRGDTCLFNDDIQGTAAVALAGLLAAQKLTGRPLAAERFLFYGAGEAGAGIADLIAAYIAIHHGTTVEDARGRIFMMDSRGLLVSSRTDKLAHHKLNFVRDAPPCKDLLECVTQIKPTALIGVAAVGGAFTEEVVKAMVTVQDELAAGEAGERLPVVMALSNPTSKAECTAQQAYAWSGGRVVFASGSPMPGAIISGKELRPGQGNNAYIFPGLGLAAVAAGALRIEDAALLRAAEALAEQVGPGDLATGTVYPPLANIREVSLQIAVAVARHMHDSGVATLPQPSDLKSHIAALMYDPRTEIHS